MRRMVFGGACVSGRSNHTSLPLRRLHFHLFASWPPVGRVFPRTTQSSWARSTAAAASQGRLGTASSPGPEPRAVPSPLPLRRLARPLLGGGGPGACQCHGAWSPGPRSPDFGARARPGGAPGLAGPSHRSTLDANAGRGPAPCTAPSLFSAMACMCTATSGSDSPLHCKHRWPRQFLIGSFDHGADRWGPRRLNACLARACVPSVRLLCGTDCVQLESPCHAGEIQFGLLIAAVTTLTTSASPVLYCRRDSWNGDDQRDSNVAGIGKCRYSAFNLLSTWGTCPSMKPRVVDCAV